MHEKWGYQQNILLSIMGLHLLGGQGHKIL